MTDMNEPGWERKLVEQLATEAIKEQRRRRRWGTFFKLLGFGYVGFIIFMLWSFDKAAAPSDGAAHTALVQIDGVIGGGDEVNAEQVVLALQSAFDDAGTRGVVLRINSPGGSPVQAGMINDEIRRLRALHANVPVYAVVEDICASGGYYVAVAADKIFVDKASLIGSIGVRMDGFGFTEAMNKLGVERRLVTAGENKGFLDPFSPQDPQQTEFAQQMLGEIHQQFITVVKNGRGKRLKESPEIFSGLIWTGARSVELGLSDGFGTVDSVARDIIKAEEVRDYTQRQNFAERVARQLGASFGGGVFDTVRNVGWK